MRMLTQERGELLVSRWYLNIAIDIDTNGTRLLRNELPEGLSKRFVGDRPTALLADVVFCDRDKGNAGLSRRWNRPGLEEPVVQVELNLLQLSGTPQAQNDEGAQYTGYDARNQWRLKDFTCASHRRKHTRTLLNNELCPFKPQD